MDSHSLTRITTETPCAALFESRNDKQAIELLTYQDLPRFAKEPYKSEKQHTPAIAPQISGFKTTNKIHEYGYMSLNWIDIDIGNLSIDSIKSKLSGAGIESYIVYSTASAKSVDVKTGKINGYKWRVIIPSSRVQTISEWISIQNVLANLFGGDKAASRPTQILYAPTIPQGESDYYEYSIAQGTALDPDNLPPRISDQIAQDLAKETETKKQIAAKSAAKIQKRNQSRQSEKFTIKDANNALPPIRELLKQYGYTESGDGKYLSPYSASGSPGVVVFDDMWYSHHQSDKNAKIGLEVADGCCGDAFDLFCHYEHDGNINSALKNIADQVDPEGQKKRQREYMEKNQPKHNLIDFSALIAGPAKQEQLPGFCDVLLNLPYGLGLFQDYIYGRQIYPSRATAGVAAISAFANFAMGRFTIDSMSGLGFNEYFILMAQTGFGKEDLRRAIQCVDSQFDIENGDFLHVTRPEIQGQTPSSPQGLHKLLENNPEQYFMSDEFAEWLGSTSTNDYRQQTMGYLMEIYTKPLSWVNVPAAVTRNYSAVKHPRVGIFATTTPERIVETMTTSQADAGSYNRFVMFLAEQERIKKRYEGFDLIPSEKLIGHLNWLFGRHEKGIDKVTFDKDAWDFFTEYDTDIIEPKKFNDPHLAGRLSEQAIKIAGLIALSDRRVIITRKDLKQAYEIRLNLYERVAAYFKREGALLGNDTTVIAYEQIRLVLKDKKKMALSKLVSYSRAYQKLNQNERNRVIDSLVRDGILDRTSVNGGILLTFNEINSSIDSNPQRIDTNGDSNADK